MTTITSVIGHRRPLPHLADHRRVRRDEQGRRLLGRLRRPRTPTTPSCRATGSRSPSAAATTCASRRRAQRALPLVGRDVDELVGDLGGDLPRTAVATRQLRWLGPEKGVVHLALAAVMNAVWDLAARRAGKPLWRLLAEMTPEQLVDAADLRYLSDALTRDEAIAHARRSSRRPAKQRIAELGARPATPATRPAPAGSATPTTSCAGSARRPSTPATATSSSRSAPTSTTTSAGCAIAREVHRAGRAPDDRRQPGLGRAAGDRVGRARWPSSSRCGSRSRPAPTTCSGTPRSARRWRRSASPPASTA